MCQLQAGDEVLTVNRQQVAEMSYTDWKSCMEEALQEGSLVMDIRRHGKNSESSEWCVCVCVCVCVCACVWERAGDDLNHFNGCIPGLTVLLTLLALLNSFDTLNWSVNYCEIIHEWSHDSRCNFFSHLAQEDCYCVDLAGFSFLFFSFFPVCVFLVLFFPLLVLPVVSAAFSLSSALSSISMWCFPCGELTKLRFTVLWVCCFHHVSIKGLLIPTTSVSPYKNNKPTPPE